VNITSAGGQVDLEDGVLYSTNDLVEVRAQDSVSLVNGNATSTNGKVNITSAGGQVNFDSGTLYSTGGQVEVLAQNSVSAVDGNATSTNGKVNITSATSSIDGTRGTFISTSNVEYNSLGDININSSTVESTGRAQANLGTSSATLFVENAFITQPTGGSNNQRLVYDPNDITVVGDQSNGQVRDN
jgi:hypothetical protein